MVALLSADLHLTDKAADDYRWGLFPWLREQIEKYKVDFLLLLGDVTDSKDRHSSVLVNRLVSELYETSKCRNGLIKIKWLRGNHDAINPELPFFSFVNRMSIEFLCKPSFEWIGNKKAVLLPNVRDTKDWATHFPFDDAALIFTHQTYTGCVSESGTALEGIAADYFKKCKNAKVWSGDIHVPQKVGKQVEYVGAPYRIHFGDKFEPRVVLLDKNANPTDLHFPCLKKHTVDIDARGFSDAIYSTYGMTDGDQVKVRVTLKRAQLELYAEIKEKAKIWAERHKLVLFGPELVLLDKQTHVDVSAAPSAHHPKDWLAHFVKRKKLSGDLADIGKAILDDVQS